VTDTGTAATGRWQLRSVPAALAQRYVAEEWWTDESMGDVVAKGLAAMRDSAFAVYSAVRPWRGTVGDVDRAARAFAGGLSERGIGPGDVVLIQLPNWVEAAIAFWGASYAGAVVVPVVHFYGAKELAYILNVTEPALIITADTFGRIDYLAAYGDLIADRKILWAVVGDSAAELPASAIRFDQLLEATPVDGPVPVNPDSPAVIAFTSGTTRDPKGVIHSHRTLGFEARQLGGLAPTGGPPALTGAPVGHFIGMLNALVCSLIRHEAINLIDVWNPQEVLRLMKAEQVNVGGGSTYFLTSLLDHPDFTGEHLRYMPYAGLGGSPVPVAVTERATRLGIKVYRSYGSTEHPSVTGSYITEPEIKRLTTDGHPLPGVELRLDDDGQILCRGPELFLGYTDPELTAKVFDAAGWYHTGDVGVLDDDGYLTITDRISDIIIRGGENISAQEIEELLLTLDPVIEVSVVARADDRLGERVAAVLRVRPGSSAPTLEQMRAHLATAGLAKQKWPESIHEVSDFPRTASGKVQKFRLRQQLRDGKPEFSLPSGTGGQQG
jgi:acyl-CoA synthetase